MPKSRKQIDTLPLETRWKVALRNAGTHQRAWAEAHGWTPSHVGQTVNGGRESARVMAAVLEFIEAQEAQMAARLGKTVAASNAA